MNPKLYLPENTLSASLVEIGQGADGTVYLTPDNQIIKVSVFLNWEQQDLYEIQKKILAQFQYLQDFNPSHLVKVYDVGKINYITSYKSVHGDLGAFIYSYSMEKLDPISENERRVFDLISHRDAGPNKQINAQVFENSEKLCRFYDIEYLNVKTFLQQVQSSNIVHLDVHPRNIMKNEQNGYKLIDLDRITIHYS